MNFDDLKRDYEEENLEAAVTTVTAVEEGLHIILECDDWRDLSSRLKFTIRCVGVAEATVVPSSVGWITCPNDHPLLWQHTQPQVDLYYSAPPPNEHELLGCLYAAHMQIFNGWRSPSEYIHATPTMLRTGYGLLARGPERVIAAYRAVAEPLLRLSSVVSYTPSADKTLLLIDSSFVICRQLLVI